LAGDLVLVEQVVHRRAADAELDGGPADVAVSASQGLDHDLPFGPAACLPQRESKGPVGGRDAEIGRGDAAPAGHDDGAVDRILQLADVTGPGVMDDRLPGLIAELQVPAVVLTLPTQELVGEDADVLAALAQRWQR